MKKILILLAVLAIGFLTVNAQTVIKTDQVRTFTLDSSLIESESFSNTYYAKDFLRNVRVQLNADTVAASPAELELEIISYGSTNNVDWTSAGDTIRISTTNHGSETGKYTDVFYDYWKVEVVTNATTQTLTTSYNILFDVND